MPPPESGPVDFMYPSLGPPKDRPHQGPSLKIHEGQAVRGGTRELPWQLDLDFYTLLLVFDSSFSHAIHECLGSVWVRLKGFRQKSWPNDPCVKETKVTLLLGDVVIMDECLSLFFVQTLHGVTRTRTQEARSDYCDAQIPIFRRLLISLSVQKFINSKTAYF